MITRSHAVRPAAIDPLTHVHQTVQLSAPPTPRPSPPPTFRRKRANPALPPVVPEALSAAQRQAAAIQRIFQDQAYGERVVGLFRQVDRTLLAEFETMVLKPLLQAGFFAPDLRGDAIGYACVERWLSNYGADTSQYGPSLSNAVSALIQIVNHIDTHYQPTPIASPMRDGMDTSIPFPAVPAADALDKAQQIEILIRDLALTPDTLIQFSENLQRINNNPVGLNVEVLYVFRQYASNSPMLCRMLLVLAQNHAPPYGLTQAHGEALAVALARHPSATEAQQLEIKAWIEERNENRKTIRYLALMGSASDAGVEPLPLRLRRPIDAPAPYRQIWQLLEQTPRDEMPLDANPMIEQLSNLVPEAYRAATTNGYRQMQALGLMNNRNNWILPLLRPDMAVELEQSQLLERLHFERTDFELGSPLLDYVGIARSGHWLSVYRFLSPVEPIPLDQQTERLYTLAVRNKVLPAVDSIDDTWPLLALEGVKQQLANLEVFPRVAGRGFLLEQPQIAALAQWRVFKNLMFIQYYLSLPRIPGNVQTSAIVQAIRAQIPAADAAPAVHIAALTSMTALTDALQILTKNFTHRVDTAMIDALRLAGPHAPLIARVLDGVSPERVTAYMQSGGIQQFIALMPSDRTLSPEEDRALVAIYKRSGVLSAVRTTEITAWLNEPVPNKKRLRWLSLMIFPTDAPGLKFPLNVNAPVHAPPPYDLIWQILNRVNKVRPSSERLSLPAGTSAQIAPLKQPEPLRYIVEDSNALRESFIQALSQLAPLEDQVAVQAVYKKMISLGLIDFENLEHLVLPLLRPELAPEILHSSLLKNIANLQQDIFLYENVNFRTYLNAISETQWHQRLYWLLQKDLPVSVTPVSSPTERQGIEKPHLGRAAVAVAHIRSDVEIVLNHWHAPKGAGFLGSPLMHPTVELLHRWIEPLRRATEPSVRRAMHAVLCTLQWVTTHAKTHSDAMTTLHWIERICTVFSRLPELASGRWDPQTVLAVAQAGVHASAFVRLINGLPARLYTAIVQQEGAMSNVLSAFIRHARPIVNSARADVLDETPSLDGFIRALERCAHQPTPAKRLRAWGKLILWGPSSSVTRTMLTRLFLPGVQSLLQLATRAARQYLDTLLISVSARDRLLLLWLTLPKISQQLAAVVKKSAANGQLESTIWALDALIPGAFDNSVDQSRLAALLDISPATLAKQLRPSPDAPTTLPPRLQRSDPSPVQPSAPLPSAARSLPPSSPTRGALEIRPTPLQSQSRIALSDLPQRSAASADPYRIRPR